MAVYRYHIINRAGERVESNIPTEEQAHTYIEFLREQNPHDAFTVEQERVYLVRGLGRDPDLH